jgi:hypothetical protein
LSPALLALERRVLSDPALERRLRDTPDRQTFLAGALAIAAEAVIALGKGDLEAALAEAKSGWLLRRALLSPRPPRPAGPIGPGWVPIAVRVLPGQTEPCIEWAWLGGTTRRELFFDLLVEEAMQAKAPFPLLFRRETGPLELERAAEGRPDPAGLIFHVSRCGSTLVGRMLATMPGLLVLGEPSPIEGLLLAAERLAVDRAQRVAWLRALVRALGGIDEGSRMIVKLDSFQSLDLPLFEAAFPEVPWVFLVREPLEVLVSNLRTVSARSFFAPTDRGLPGVSVEQAQAMGLERYLVRLVGAYLEAAARHVGAHGSHGRLIDYQALPGAVRAEILPHFGLSASDEALELLAAEGRLDAKNRGRTAFVADSANKRAEAGPELRALCAEGLETPYRSLCGRIGLTASRGS